VTTGTRLTRRLSLQPVSLDHIDDLLLLHADRDVASWHGGAWSRERALAFARSCEERRALDGVSKWMAYDRGSGVLIGRGGLSRTTIEGSPRLEVGWTLRRESWGHGFATEIGSAGLACAFDEVRAPEVVAFTEPHNERSLAVMVRLGMINAGEIKHHGDAFVLFRIGPEEYHDKRGAVSL
jgi:RimJ/RimL family protein N-acetyltransferase